ncbi:uncharacterized protein DS421_13g440420 [Arachis hypogaea]|nr:uncharacterized protein DS421_13g440420 [Arachis hypogaea]
MMGGVIVEVPGGVIIGLALTSLILALNTLQVLLHMLSHFGWEGKKARLHASLRHLESFSASAIHKICGGHQGRPPAQL